MLTSGTWYTYCQIIFMPKGTFKPYLLCELFAHEKAGFPQTNEESPLFFVYRIKSRFSVQRRNPNPSPTWKIKFGFLSFVFCCRKRYSPESLAAQWVRGFAHLVFLFFCAFFKPFPNPHIDILTKPCANRIGKKGHASAQPSFLLQSYDLLI